MSVAERRLMALETVIDYRFEDRDLALRALTHSSFGDGRRYRQDNEQLEFLGDRVLGLLTADLIFRDDLNNEGIMARQLNALVRKETCARVALEIGLGDALRMSSSEEKHGGRNKVSILGDACEALLAAIYLDGGMQAAEKFYMSYWMAEYEKIRTKSTKDPKTELQEKSTSYGGGLPEYVVIDRSGPDHKPLYVVEVQVKNMGSARGTGKSKKDAERYAAMHLLENWSG